MAQVLLAIAVAVGVIVVTYLVVKDL